MKTAIPRETIQRLPKYLAYLKEISGQQIEYISSLTIAEYFNLTPILVKKDLSKVSSIVGRPRVGFLVDNLIKDIEICLGYDNMKDALLVGVGKLGSALLSYGGFQNYGLNIVAGMDSNPNLVGTEVSGKKIFSPENAEALIKRMHIKLGIITAPAAEAQAVCDFLINAGMKGIWNFTPAHLKVPDDVVVKNENMAESLALLSVMLQKR